MVTSPTKEYDGSIDKGLEGIVACTTKISSIIDATLTYRGYVIEDLAAKATFEDVVFLLWNDRFPSKEESQQLRSEIVKNMNLDSKVIQFMKALPAKTAVPMDFLRTCVSSLAMLDPDSTDTSEAANRRKAIRLTGQVGAIVSAFQRLRDGKEVLSPDLSKSVAWNFFYLMNGEKPSEQVVKAFDTCLVLHADHELNCSAFAARVTTSSLADMHAAITSPSGSL